MWQRFSGQAKRAVFRAQEEAGRLGENYVSTEHLLLGLLRENDSGAMQVLDRMGITHGRVRSEIERQATPGDGRLGQDMQITPRVKRVIDLSYEEARRLSRDSIRSEHLLLGLIRESEGLAGRILQKLGVDLDRARREAAALQGPETDGATEPDQAAGVQDNDASVSSGQFPTDPLLKGEGGMWQRFTERSRRVVFFAQEEAGRLGQNHVDGQHLLLGLVRENDSGAARILDRMGISLGRIRSEVERQVTRGDGRLGQDMQLTPNAKRVIDLAYDEAKLLNNNYIGTEHLLLAMVRYTDSLPGRVLTKLGADLERTRREVLSLQYNDSAKSSTKHNMSTQVNDLKQVIQGAPDIETAEQILQVRKIIGQDEHGWRRKSLVSLFDVSIEQYKTVLDVAARLKALDQKRMPGIAWEYPRTLGMIFEKPSLRTRVSFEASMVHLHGHAIYLAPGDVGLNTRESAEDVAGVLSRWVDIITARVFAHETVEELARFSTSPVVNALSDLEHPIQTFADLLTLQEQKGPLGNNLKLAYVGDGNNVVNALLIACAKTGINFTAACPDGYHPDAGYLAHAVSIAAQTGAKIDVVVDPAAAVVDADAVYTDVWASMGQESEKEERAKIFAPYQLNAELMAKAKPDAVALHCLPAHRGDEITAEVMDRHKATILDEAENRLHTQKALLALIVGL